MTLCRTTKRHYRNQIRIKQRDRNKIKIPLLDVNDPPPPREPLRRVSAILNDKIIQNFFVKQKAPSKKFEGAFLFLNKGVRSHHHANPACVAIFPVKVFYSGTLPTLSKSALTYFLQGFFSAQPKKRIIKSSPCRLQNDSAHHFSKLVRRLCLHNPVKSLQSLGLCCVWRRNLAFLGFLLFRLLLNPHSCGVS